jgi:hypothetical protein
MNEVGYFRSNFIFIGKQFCTCSYVVLSVDFMFQMITTAIFRRSFNGFYANTLIVTETNSTKGKIKLEPSVL